MGKLILDTVREGYGTDQVNQTMTAGELIAVLEEYAEDTPVYLAFDRRYTYGGITVNRFEYMNIRNEDDDDMEESR